MGARVRVASPVLGGIMFRAALLAVPAPLQEALRRHRLDEPVALGSAVEGLSAGELRALAVELVGLSAAPTATAALEQLVAVCARCRPIALAQVARASDVEIGLREAKRTRTAPPVGPAWREVQRGLPPPPGSAPKWPARRPPGGSGAPNPTARRDKEVGARARWLAEAVEVVRQAGLPLANLAAASAEPDAVFTALGQGLRARTLRQKVLAMRALSAYLQSAHQVAFPATASQVLDYLHTRAQEPCGRTVPAAVLQSLAFFERGGGVDPAHQLSRHPALGAAAAELAMTLGQGSAGHRGSARRYPAAVVAAWEAHVLRLDVAPYHRAYAWWKAVKVWASLRFDDHRGLVPAGLTWADDKGLAGTLTRTKTTGRGKRVENLPLFVSCDAFLHDPAWLPTGFQIWQSFGADRDFFLPRPEPGGESVTRMELSYHLASGMSRALNRELVTAGAGKPPLSAFGRLELVVLVGTLREAQYAQLGTVRPAGDPTRVGRLTGPVVGQRWAGLHPDGQRQGGQDAAPHGTGYPRVFQAGRLPGRA